MTMERRLVACGVLWDIFTQTERLCISRNLPASIGGSGKPYYDTLGLEARRWDQIELPLQEALARIDWEFNLGRRLTGFSK